ncbi:GAF domain-containing protein [bacterium]|nr:GAF domain-containing protein [bacterium]
MIHGELSQFDDIIDRWQAQGSAPTIGANMDQELEIDRFIYNSSWVRLGIIFFIFLIIFLPHAEIVNTFGICMIIILSAVSCFVYRALPDSIKTHQTFPYLVYTLDVLFLTLIIDFMGGIISNFHIIYLVPLVLAAVYFDFAGWLYVIILVTTSYLIGILAHIEDAEKIGYSNLLATTLPLFWGVTCLVGFLSSKLKKYKREIEIKSNMLNRTKAKKDKFFDLYETAIKMFGLTNLDNLLEYMAKEILQLIDMERCIVLFLNDDANELVGYYSNKLSPARVKEMLLKKGDELFILLIEKKEGLIITDTAREEHVAKRFIERHKIKSLVAMPLIIEDKVLGVLWIDNQEKIWEYNHKSIEDIRKFLTHAATVAMGAAHSRRALDRLKKKAAILTQKLDDIANKFTAIEKFTQQITASVSIDEMTKAFDEAADTLNLKSYRLLLLDATNDVLFTLAWRGFLSNEIKIKVGEGPAGKVAITGIPTYSTPLPTASGGGDITNYELYETPLCLPLKKQNKVVGIIEIRSVKENTGIDNINYQILLTLANLFTAGLSKKAAPQAPDVQPIITLDNDDDKKIDNA